MCNKIATSVEQSRELLKLGLDPITADFHWSVVEKFITKDGELKYAVYVLVQNGGNEIDCEGDDDDAPEYNIERPRMKHDDVPAWSLTALLGLLPTLFQNTETGEVQLFDQRVADALDNKEYDKYKEFYPQMLHGNKIAIGYIGSNEALFVDDGGKMGGYHLVLGVYGGWVDATHCTLCWLLEHGLVEKNNIIFEAPKNDKDDD